MPTYKNIRIPMKNGKSRLQRVQVLASGKYKFVKNVGTKAKKAGKKAVKTVRSRSRASKVKKMGNNGKMFRTLSAKGALEDFAWGFGGIALMGHNNPVALPAIRLIQGAQGHILDRPGKGRLVYALIDLADLVITGQASIQSIFDNVRQLTKVSSLIRA